MANPILPHATDVFTSAAVASLGQKFEDGAGNTFRYVRFKDAVTYAAGQCCWWDDQNTYEVTNDESGAENDGILAGIVNGVPAEDDYGLIQTGGLYENALKTPGQDAIAPGTILVGDYITPTDGKLYPFNGAASTAGNPTNAELLLLLENRSGYCKATDTSDDTNDKVDVEIFCESV